MTLCIPLCICRLTLAWISSEISTKLQGMPTHLDRSSFTAAGLYLMRLVSQMSGVDSPPPLCVSRRQMLPLSSFVQLLTRVPLPTSGHVEDRGLKPLFGFAPKQTKGSSAWRTTYIVSQYHPRSRTGDLQGDIVSCHTHVYVNEGVWSCVCVCVYMHSYYLLISNERKFAV